MMSSKIQLRVQTGWELGPQGNVEVYEWFYLDLGPEDKPIKVEFTFDVADIREISGRNSSYSYPFNVPNNKHNRKIFQFINNLSMVQGFDARKQLRAYYIENEIVVFDGFIEYKEYVIDPKEGTKEFSLIFYGDNDTLFNKSNNKTLGDIDFTQYNFVHSTPNIISTWTASVGHPYRYGLVDRGWNWILQNINGNLVGTASMVELNELTIAVNKKMILDNIFSSNGLSYTSDDLNSDDFKNQYLVFNTIPKQVLPPGRFDFEYNQDVTPVTPLTQGGQGNWQYQYINFIEEVDNSDLYNPSGSQGSQIQNNLSVPITYDFTIQIRIDVVQIESGRVLDNPAGHAAFSMGLRKNGLPENYETYNLYVQQGFSFWIGPTTTLDGNTMYITRRFVGTINPGEYINIFLRHNNTLNEFSSVTYSGNINGDFNFVDLFDGSTLDFNSLITSNIKQLDFLSSIIKERNLMVVPIKNQPNRFLIECRDTFYNTGEVKDWTDKLDTNNKLIEKPIVDDKTRNIIFTHKQDKDYYLEKYNTNYNEIYGQYNFDTLNENIKGEKKIETIFSPTCLVDVANSSFFPISVITKDTKEGHNQDQPPKDAVSFNVRQFYYKWVEIPSENNNFCFNGTQFGFYPYLGHLSDPYNPSDSVDINFGPPKNVYFANSGVSQNGLFERFWSKTMEELTDQDSRLVTAYLKLDPYDIYNFKFNDKIFIFYEESGQYYKVNKIIQWNPVTKAPCKVELIKSKYVLVPPKRDILKPVKPLVIIRDPVEKTTLKINGLNNDVNKNSNDIYVDGQNNKLYEGVDSAFINGNGITVGTESNSIFFTGTNIKSGTQSENLYAVGTNIEFASGVTNSVAFGNNIYATESNSIYLGSEKIFLNGEIILTGTISGSFSIPVGLQDVLDYNNIDDDTQFSIEPDNNVILGRTNNSITGNSENSSIISSYNSTIDNGNSTCIISGAGNDIFDAGQSFVASCRESMVNPQLPFGSNFNRTMYLIGGFQSVYDGYSKNIMDLRPYQCNYYNVRDSFFQNTEGNNLFGLTGYDIISSSFLTATASSNSYILKSSFLDAENLNNSMLNYVNSTLLRNVDNSTLFNCYGVELYDVGYSFILNLNLSTLDGVTASTILSPVSLSAIDSSGISVIGGNNNTILQTNNSQMFGGSFNYFTASDFSQMIGGDINTSYGNNGGQMIGGSSNILRGSLTSQMVGGELNLLDLGTKSLMIGGSGNSLTSSNNSLIIGGSGNLLQTDWHSAVIIGGINNRVGPSTGGWSTIVGGDTNTIVGFYANISGGVLNNIGLGTYSNGNYSFIGGGWGNTIYATSSLCRESGIVGGFENLISTRWSFIGGGYQNNIKSAATQSAILGGKSNTIENGVERSVILGGQNIIALQNDTAYVPNLISKSDTPSSTVQSSAGSGASVSITGTNIAGSVSITAGTGTGTGQILSVTFSNSFSYPNGCSVVLFAQDALSASYASLAYATSTTSTWSVFVTSPLSTGQTYTWNYQVMGY